MNNSLAVRRNVNPFADGLVASYCRGCGLLIAASTKRKSLDVMEKAHKCPVYFHYEQGPERDTRFESGFVHQAMQMGGQSCRRRYAELCPPA
jgi:hypothetical protein